MFFFCISIIYIENAIQTHFYKERRSNLLIPNLFFIADPDLVQDAALAPSSPEEEEKNMKRKQSHITYNSKNTL